MEIQEYNTGMVRSRVSLFSKCNLSQAPYQVSYHILIISEKLLYC